LVKIKTSFAFSFGVSEAEKRNKKFKKMSSFYKAHFKS
jgi:hypothetical protein